MSDIIYERYDEATGIGINWYSLLEAIGYRDFDGVKEKIKNGELRKINSWNLLHMTLEFNYPEIVELLIQNGASVDSVFDFDDSTTSFITPLHIAALKNNMEVARILLKYGASVSSKINGGYDPIHLAVFCGHEEMVALLLDNGADINARFNNKFFEKTRLNLQDTLVLEDEMLKSLWQDQDLPLLHCSILRKFNGVAMLLLKHGADVDLKTNSGKTTLMQAVEINNFYVVHYLVTERNANVNDRDIYGQPVIHFLVLTARRKLSKYSKETNVEKMRRVEILKLLMQHGADVNARFPENCKYSSILHYMIQYGFYRGVEALLYFSDLDLNIVDFNALYLSKINTQDFTSDIMNDFNYIHFLRLTLEVITNYLVAFAISRQMVGLPVDNNLILESPILEWYSREAYIERMNIYKRGIDDELNYIKNTTIGDSDITVYYLLTCKMNELVKLMSNKRLNIVKFMQEILEINITNYKLRKVYYYSRELRSRIILADFRNSSSKQCVELISNIFINQLPMDCCEVIVNYFDDDTLSKFTGLVPDDKIYMTIYY